MEIFQPPNPFLSMCLIQVGTEDGNEMANTGARSTTEADPEESFHAVSPCLEAPRSPVPMVSIVEATRDVVYEMGIHRVGLFGTRFTMQWCFYPEVFRRFQKYSRNCSSPESGAAPYSLRSTPSSGGRPYGT